MLSPDFKIPLMMAGRTSYPDWPGILYHGTAMMDTIFRLREKYNLHMKVERYLLNDEIPDSDKKYIKE